MNKVIRAIEVRIDEPENRSALWLDISIPDRYITKIYDAGRWRPITDSDGVSDEEVGKLTGYYQNEAATTVTVGGIKAGSTFVEPVSYTDLITRMLYEELYPTLTSPTFSLSITPKLVKVSSGHDVKLNASFNRGSISPAYGTDGYRAGEASSYIFISNGVRTEVKTTASSLVGNAPTNFVKPGMYYYGCSIYYSEGQQPLTNFGNEYKEPLPEGMLHQDATVEAVYPTYATTSSIVSLAEQPLVSESTPYIQVKMVSENPNNRQKFRMVNQGKAVTGIKFYDTVAKAFKWLNDDQHKSLELFDKTSETIDGLDYILYTRKGAVGGAITLQFYR